MERKKKWKSKRQPSVELVRVRDRIRTSRDQGETYTS